MSPNNWPTGVWPHTLQVIPTQTCSFSIKCVIYTADKNINLLGRELDHSPYSTSRSDFACKISEASQKQHLPDLRGGRKGRADPSRTHSTRPCNRVPVHYALGTGLCIINTWNSLSESVIYASTTDSFRNKPDKFWSNQDLIYDWLN